MENIWSFSGEVVRLKEHTYHDIGATLTVRGIAGRSNEAATSIAELNFFVPPDIYQSAKNDGLRNYSKIEMQGHFESWATATDNNYRTSLKLYVDFLKITKR